MRNSLLKWSYKFRWGIVCVALLVFLEAYLVREHAKDNTVTAYQDADTLSEIALYDAADPDLYVRIMSETEFATGGFADFSDALFNPSAEEVESDEADTEGAAAASDEETSITHTSMLYLFLPYNDGTKDWRLGIAEGVVLDIDGNRYHSGDKIAGLADDSRHTIGIYDTDGTARELGTLTVRYNGDVPVLFASSEDVKAYNEIRFTKHIQTQVSWFCLDAAGAPDSYGDARMSGHGNSTYDYGHKKPVNLRLDTKTSILDMGAVEKYVLIANSMDYSGIKDKIVYEAARRLGMDYTPECEYVCYYLNGEYQGLYLLSQKVDIGKGCVQGENDLDSDAKDLNDGYPAFEVGYGGLQTEHPYAFFEIPNTPKDYSGAYLLELQMPGFSSDYIGAEDHDAYQEGAWFRTDVLDMLIRSPRYASEKEVTYIRDLTLEAEKALYAADGINPDTGKSYTEYFDVDSWGEMLLMEDFFALQDYSMGSIFVLKRQGDDMLYSGPIWDYDKALTDNFYDTDEFTFPIDGQTGLVYWMYQFSCKEEIRERMREVYVNQFSDIMMQMIGEDIPAWRAQLQDAARNDNLRWGEDENTASDWAARVEEWCVGRTAFFNGVWISGDIEDPNGKIWGKLVDHNGNDILEGTGQ